MAQRKVYYIPDNFVDDEKIFGGKFRKRNFIEAVIFTLPVLGLFWLINWATGMVAHSCELRTMKYTGKRYCR